MQLFFGVFMSRDKTLNLMQTVGNGQVQAMNKQLLGDHPKVLTKVAMNLKEFVLKK